MKLTQRMEKYFLNGYDSGNIEIGLADPMIMQEYKDSGGNYKTIFDELIKKHIKANYQILEIGPGKGSWTKEVLKYTTSGTLHAVDVLDIKEFLYERCGNTCKHLQFHQINDLNYDIFKNYTFDFVFSMGVFVHMRLSEIEQLLSIIKLKIKPKSKLVIHYSNWDKLEKYGWQKARIPESFKDDPEAEDVWWTKNNCEIMETIFLKLGYTVQELDTNHMKRDSIALLSVS